MSSAIPLAPVSSTAKTANFSASAGHTTCAPPAALPKKLSRATAFMHCSALEANAQLTQALAPNAQLLAVIKANAYGHGMLRSADILFHYAYGFAVANMYEAVELRQHLQKRFALQGQHKPVVVMSAIIDSEALAVCREYQLTPVIHSIPNSKREQAAISDFVSEHNSWLKIDTGMHRLGIEADSIPNDLAALPFSTIMTHYSQAQQLSGKQNQQQVILFNQALRAINGRSQHQTSAITQSISIANSAALLRHCDARKYKQWYSDQFDNYDQRQETIRPGIMLYGVDPLTEQNNTSAQLQPVMTLAAPVISTRSISAGETVGYNGTWYAQRDSVIATIAIGYGDGYPRHAPNGTAVVLHGQRATLAGTVSMDSICIDITDLNNQGIEVQPGDLAQLWGKQLAVNEIAASAHTIGYELLTGIADRVNKIYL